MPVQPTEALQNAVAAAAIAEAEVNSALILFNQALWLGNSEQINKTSNKATTAFQALLDCKAEVIAIAKRDHPG